MGKSNLEKVGTYRGTIASVSMETTKNGLPMAVIGLDGNEFYAQEPEDLAAAGLTEPGYVEIETAHGLGFFVLVDNKGKLTGWADGVAKATGWQQDGFDYLVDTDLVGRPCLFSAETNEYNGETSIRVNRIDTPDADPNNGRRSIDPDDLKALNARFASAFKPRKVAPAKVASGMRKPATGAANGTTTPKSAVFKLEGAANGTTTPKSAVLKLEGAVLGDSIPTEDNIPF